MESALAEAAAALAAPVMAGALCGLLMGSLRTGGGALLAPLLLYAWDALGLGGLEATPTALGSAAAALALLAGQALFAEGRRRHLPPEVRRLAPWTALGGALLAVTLARAEAGAAATVAGVGLFATALLVVFLDPRSAPPSPEGWRGLLLAAALGALGGGLAQGAGAAGAPLLRGARRSPAETEALLAALGLAAAAPAALVFLLLGSQAGPPFALGAVDPVAALAAPAAAAAAAPQGLALAKKAPPQAPPLIHALLLAVAGLSLLRFALGG